jgi:hypothetical protein
MLRASTTFHGSRNELSWTIVLPVIVTLSSPSLIRCPTALATL